MDANLLLDEDATLLDVVDRLLDRGVVAVGDVTLSVADIDLVYLGLRAVLCGIVERRGPSEAGCGNGHGPEFGIRDSEFAMDDGGPELRISNSECPRDSGLGIRNLGWIEKPDCGSGDPPRIPNPELRTPRASGNRQRATGNGGDPAKLGAGTGLTRNEKRETRNEIGLDPQKVENGLVKLVLTLVEFIRQVLERQALRRVESGTLTEEEIERLGLAFFRLQEKIEELKDFFGLADDELNLKLGPLGNLM